ncbi:MAG: PTS lactose/cellobiose transporter subunit IIA [Clostridiales bacterium]|jgi:PTS system cellobiose-specific IIA component|nr:PTS lactose/cellobiose transporter subunit IIA [Clostridiales bacterium]
MQISAEDIIMNLVTNGGDARSKAIEAIREARAGNFAEADRLMSESRESSNAAHRFQTLLMQTEMDESHPQKVEVSLLMAHGQDHLMNALTVQDLAIEVIEILRERSR